MKLKYDYTTIYDFSMISFLFVGITGVLLSVFMFSCSSPAKNTLLLYADSLMEERPDSALSILESIPVPQKLSRSDRALYALLLTQARHKNFVTLDNDSLIKIAVDYYGDGKKDFRASQAHYYLGATYRDMGRNSFAVEEYLKAIQLMPEENEFLAMIYDNLAECYEDEDLYNTAMGAYRKAYQILKKDDAQIHPLRGIAHVFLLQDQMDSALYYYQKAFDSALSMQDTSWMAILNHDFAMAYVYKKDYSQAYERISQAVEMIDLNKADNVYQTKGRIMLYLNELDSARHYFNKYKDNTDISGRVICYEGLYQIEKKKGNWKTAVENADIYMLLYDSIQGISDGKELAQLMDRYQLEEHKEKLSQHTKMMTVGLIIGILLFVIVFCFYFIWNVRKSKLRYIALQEELTQKRIEVIQLKEVAVATEETSNNYAELREQQFEICMQIFQTTDCYEKLQIMETASGKKLLSMRVLIPAMNKAIHNAFIDVMTNLKECCPSLTNDDLFYCILSLIHCSRNTVVELMNVSLDALKTRKSRIKNKMKPELFEYIFRFDNQ